MSASNYQDIIRQFQQAQDAANQANERRYQDILGLYSKSGQTARTRASRGYSEGVADDTQSLISRGLYNTGTLDSARRGRARDLEDQNQAIDEQVSNQQAGVMERRTDQGPNSGQFADLLASLTRSQAIDNPGRTQTTVGAVPGHSYSMAGGGGSGGGGGVYSGAAGGSGGGGGGGSGRLQYFAPGTAPAGARPHQYTPNFYFVDPVSGAGRGGGNVDAVEGSNYGRQNITSNNPATAALRRMYSGYSSSLGA